MDSSKRLIYMDVARGAAMITVIYSHILIFGMSGYQNSSLIDFMRLFYLTGFFFISGYFLSTKLLTCDFRGLLDFIVKKARQLLIPTLICMAIYAFTHDTPFMRALRHDAKWGYWFTFVLFEMFVIAGIVLWILLKTKRRWVVTAGMLFLAAATLAISRTGLTVGVVQDYFSLSNLMGYMAYFVMGFLCRYYSELFDKWVISGRVVPCVVLALLIGGIYGITPSFITTFCAVITVLYIANRLIDSVIPPPVACPSASECTAKKASDGLLPCMLKGLAYVGRNTIEVYFMHYFLLFVMPLGICEYLSAQSGHNQAFIELIIVGTTAVVIAIGSIIFARILKCIPFLSQLLFGKPDTRE